MGYILVGIVIGVIFGGVEYLYINLADDPDTLISAALILAGVVIFLVCTTLGIVEPVSGYEEPVIFSETNLISLQDQTLSEGGGNLFYVAISGTNSYTYYVEIDSPYVSGSQKAYKSYTVSGDNITIVEDESYVDAKLVKYVSHGKKSFWTFAMSDKYDYVFYVPKGTVARNISLGE